MTFIIPSDHDHELALLVDKSYQTARENLEKAFEYLGATDTRNTDRLRLALGAIAVSCDAVKVTANAYSTMLGHVARMRRGADGDR